MSDLFKITRTIEGKAVEIELTEQEVCKIFFAKEKAFTKQDCEEMLKTMYAPILYNDTILEEVATLYEKFNANDTSQNENLIEAIHIVMTEQNKKLGERFSKYGITGKFIIETIEKAIATYDKDSLYLELEEDQDNCDYWVATIRCNKNHKNFAVSELIYGRLTYEQLIEICDDLGINYIVIDD